MKAIFENVIQRGGFDLTGLLKKIDSYHIEGKLTDQERDDLYALARRKPEAQYDCKEEIERLWAAVRELQQGNDAEPEAPADEWSEFVQPTGAHDAYQVGAKITHGGKRYICNRPNCVWAPDVLPEAWDAVE